jgi:hypothetical protein
VAIKIGSFAASAKLPVDDIIDLISKLGEEEGEAEANGLDSSGRLVTCATLHQWAVASDFPSAWPDADVIDLAQALGALKTAWGDEFKQRLVPLVVGWARPMLQPDAFNPTAFDPRVMGALLDAII